MVAPAEGMVYVSPSPVEGATEAVDGPYFVNKSKNKYYLTVATWEFDPQAAAASGDPVKIAACAQIQQMFDAAQEPPATPQTAGTEPTVTSGSMTPLSAGGATRGGGK